jgi:hypothetical protein
VFIVGLGLHQQLILNSEIYKIVGIDTSVLPKGILLTIAVRRIIGINTE